MNKKFKISIIKFNKFYSEKEQKMRKPRKQLARRRKQRWSDQDTPNLRIKASLRYRFSKMNNN